MKDFSLNDDLLPPFLPIGSFMSMVEITRMTKDEEKVPMMKMTIFMDIDDAKERKSFKMF